MSAKRRADAIARFSVPLESIPTVQVPQEISTSAVASRSRRVSRNASYNVDPTEDDDDEDFVMPSADNNYSDDDEVTAAATWKSKGKGKAKRTQGDSENEDHFSFGDTQNQNNPPVMLISLKAGAFGLNLTGELPTAFRGRFPTGLSWNQLRIMFICKDLFCSHLYSMTYLCHRMDPYVPVSLYQDSNH